jgi:hypothetical protein
VNETKSAADRPEGTPLEDESYPPGATGIDEARVLDAVLRLAEVAQEVGWPTTLRVIADVMSRRDRT